MSRKLVVEIVGDARSLEKAFAKSSKSAKNFSGDIDKTGNRSRRAFGGITRGAVGMVGGLVSVTAAVGVAKAAFTEMGEAQKVAAQTNAVLKSTGKAAHVSARQVEDLAESLMTMSGVDDELIQQGENLLLTFKNIRNETGRGNDIFDQATKAMLDMSVALGQDATQSAIQLGKALNDPVKGVTALRRVGVSFTAAQIKQIKTLVATGKTLQAQKLILRELTQEFGGSARAAGQTLPGKLNILRNTMLNLAGSIAAMLTPAITRLVNKMVAWLTKSQNQKRVLDTVRAAANAVATVVKVLTGAFNALNAITGSTQRTFKLLLAGFIVFKGLKLVAYIGAMTKAMRGFAVASAAASAAGAGGGGGRVGKLGRLSRLAKFGVGGPIGLAVGATALTAQMAAPYVRNPRHARPNPNTPARIRARNQVHVTVGVDRSANLVPRVEQQLTKRNRGRPRRRRGAR